MREAITLNAALISQPFVRDDITVATRYNILEFCDGLRRGAPVALREVPSRVEIERSKSYYSDLLEVVPRGRVVGQQEGRLSLRQQERLG